jgi:hypothetical protein
VNALARFEDFVEDILEGSLTQLLRSPVQPAEIAKRLERAMESGQRAAVGKVLVPTRYTVSLHPDDYAALAPARGALEREMARFIVERARERGFSLLARPRVSLAGRPEVRRRRLVVVAAIIDTEEEEQTLEIEWTPPLGSPLGEARSPRARLRYGDAAGRPCEVRLDRPQVTLGRARDNDVILDDPRVSRYHARIILRYGQHVLQDLGSTHGTLVNGEAVQECVLRPGDLLTLGGAGLYYEEV